MTDETALRIALDVCGELRGLTEVVARVGDLIELALTEDAPPQAEEAASCQHPADQRVDFSGQGVEEWECRACRHHYGPVRLSEVAHVG